MADVISYEDRKYEQKENLYDALAQVMEDVKEENRASSKWNTPVQEIEGITYKLLSTGLVEILFHRYEVGTVETIGRNENHGKQFIGKFVERVKKSFKKKTGETLLMKEVELEANKKDIIEKTSKVEGERTWILGANLYGLGQRPVGRYLIRTSCVYEVESQLL